MKKKKRYKTSEEKRKEEIRKKELARAKALAKDELKKQELGVLYWIRKFLRLDYRKIVGLVLLWLGLILAHNLLNILWGVSERFLSFLAIIIVPLYLIAALAYTFVHGLIEKKILKEIKRRIKYPKFILLASTFILAYILFKSQEFEALQQIISRLGYLGTFIAGSFFTYGFTAAPATALLLILGKQQNILIAALIGGFGALFGDWIIFNFIRTSFQDELEKLENERITKYLKRITPNIIEKYLLPVIAGFIIASPLPDEIGVSMLALLKDVKTKTFMVISYCLNTIGIWIILLIGSSL